jgi:carbonic anhydrase
MQNPYAVVVTCADSRVAPELIFDEGMGFLFVIRSKSSPHTHHCTRTRTR